MGKHIDAWGKNCKKQMIERDMSLQDIATTTGYTRTYISAIINGRVIVPDETKEKIGKALSM